tara:strand:- start:1017 stop:1217 length:201 start_codon:yes stop_codon:yes gene_type:complete
MDKPKLLHDIKEKQKQLLFDMNKFCDKLDEVSRELKEIKKIVITLDSRIPERKDGWFGGYWQKVSN